ADAASAYRSTRSGRCAARASVLGPGASAMSSPHRSASSRYATATISRSVRSRVATSSGDATFAGLHHRDLGLLAGRGSGRGDCVGAASCLGAAPLAERPHDLLLVEP